ncbi:MAG: hypothetical protein QOK40_3275 [Miltoncostaeaceae bacterium]|jgi:uncharacterized membrane protein YcaP (DUF421 family)|nr:hypothetical protein [Miltoncostaeaceae bacterium]
MDIVARATVIFIVIFVVLRVIGRRELGNLEPFDLILLVVLGDLVQQGVTQSDYSVTGAILAICTIAVLTVAVSYLGFRFRRLRPLLEGEPIILLADGQPIERNMRRERITLEDVAAEARLQNLASLDEVRLAVLEASGEISIIPRSR